MEAGSIARQGPGTTPLPNRAEALPNKPAIKTDIAAEKAVSGVAMAEAMRFSPSDRKEEALVAAREALRKTIDKRLDFDVASRTVISQSVDTRTGEVLRQFPDAYIVKLRAYIRGETVTGHSSEGNSENRVQAVA
jgi:uncharacterized FlaG/YvyC family protein